MLPFSQKAKGLAPFPWFFPTVPHVSKLLADGRPNVAESCSCLLPCVTQSFMCFLVARNKTEKDNIMISHKTFIILLSPDFENSLSKPDLGR